MTAVSNDEKVREAVEQLQEGNYANAPTPFYVPVQMQNDIGTVLYELERLSELERLPKERDGIIRERDALAEDEHAAFLELEERRKPQFCLECDRELDRLRSAPPLFTEADAQDLRNLATDLDDGTRTPFWLRNLASRISDHIAKTR